MPRDSAATPTSLNEGRPAAGLRLKRWTFAGLFLTYRCNARCAFCYVSSGPHQAGRAMDVDLALALWRGLNRLVDEGGNSYGPPGRRCCRVHFAGGEPFLDFEHMATLAEAAQRAGLRDLDAIETNAFWATTDEVTRARLERLKAAGLRRLVISADVFHQEFVPVDSVRRAARIATEVLGDGGVRVRWRDFLDAPVAVAGLTEPERRRVFAEALLRRPERLAGRAADELADLCPCHPPEHFRGQSCAEATLGSRHVHLDPYGNVFPGVCSGIVWGRIAPPGGAASPQESDAWPETFESIEALWHCAAANWRAHQVIGRVVQGGSHALYEYACQRGYTARPAGYASKCHLCHDVRRYLFAGGALPSGLGPGEVYRT